MGVNILTSCAVRGIETAAGKISAVLTEHGRIITPVVLCAAGAWSSMFCRSVGISVPQLKVRGTVARTASAERILNGAVFDEKIGIRRRQDGGYTIAHGAILDHGITPSTLRFTSKFIPALTQEFKTLRLSLGKDFIDELFTPTRWSLNDVSPFEKQRVLNPPPNPRALKKLRAVLDRTFPQLAGIEFVETWAGMVDTSPDVVPIICEADSLPGFNIATGFSGHGFGIGPGAGKAIAGMLTGTDTGIDLSEFRLSRFFDGTPIRPQTSV
jgi:glycine/D-amino acid oxidase-like deaminating enzyme